MIEEDADDLLGDGVLDIGNNHVDGYPTMRLIHVQEPEVPVNDALDLVQMVHQIVYSRSLTAAEVEEIRQMRHRIETERGDQKNPEFEFKTGPGGLIDLEFLTQTLQLLHGHAHKQLRTAHTLAALNRLTSLGLIDEEQSAQLRWNYLFLRRIESVLRRDENANVSRLPVDDREQLHLAKRLKFASAAEFLGSYHLAMRQTRAIYEQSMEAAKKV